MVASSGRSARGIFRSFRTVRFSAARQIAPSTNTQSLSLTRAENSVPPISWMPFGRPFKSACYLDLAASMRRMDVKSQPPYFASIPSVRAAELSLVAKIDRSPTTLQCGLSTEQLSIRNRDRAPFRCGVLIENGYGAFLFFWDCDNERA